MKYSLFIVVFASLNAWAQPDWVEQVKPDSSAYVGIGIGDTLANAKLDAKNQIASSISSTHSFEISQTVETIGDEGTQRSSSHTHSNADHILLPEISWPQIASEDGIYYVMGKVSKTELVNLYERTLAISSSEFSGQTGPGALSFKDYLRLFEARDELALSAKRAAIISDSSAAGKHYHAQFVELLTKLNGYQSSSCLKVNYKGHSYEGKIFKPMVESALSTAGVNVKNDAACETLDINASSESSRSGTQRVDAITLYFELGSPVVRSKTVALEGKSSGSKKAALINATDVFNRHFDRSNSLMNFLLDPATSDVVIQ